MTNSALDPSQKPMLGRGGFVTSETAHGGGGGGSSGAAVEPAQAVEDFLAELTGRVLRLRVAGAGEVAELAGGSAVTTTVAAEESFAESFAADVGDG